MYPRGRSCGGNLSKGHYPGTGFYDIPMLQADQCPTKQFIGFNRARSIKSPEECRRTGVHFFIDDYQFERAWTHPEIYLEMLQRFGCVFSPDFSTYTDAPLAVQIYNHYRKHQLGAYWQAYGLRVIPSISWSTEESFAWCFDGEPEYGTVAVSSVGVLKDPRAQELFLRGYEEMLRRLKPQQILFYGEIPAECRGNICPITPYYKEIKKRRART